MILSNQADSRFGHSVSTAGDVNGDGYADIAIGAYYFDGDLSNEGVVYVHHGNVNGVYAAASKVIEGNQLEAQFGWAVASAGDVNGDGYGDLIVGARYFSSGQNHEGSAFVYHGSSVGLDVSAASMIESNQADAWLGNAVASGGDVNGDGYSDILIGSYAFDHGQTDEGQVFVYHGSAGTVGSAPKSISGSAVSGALAGSSVSSAGDIDGNGLDDIVVGAPNFDGGLVNEGAIFISYGDAVVGTNSIIKIESNISQAKFGGSVSCAGDMNGDGYDEVIVGAVGAPNGNNVGAAYLHPGGPQGLGTTSTALFVAGNQGFGSAVSDAGDINADGFDDIIIGAPNYNAPGAAGAGAVYIFTGSGNYVSDNPTSYVTSGIGGAHLGNSLDNAGDINGDGYSDIVVGASAFGQNQSNEGAFFTWHGSGAGIPTGTLYNKFIQPDHVDAAMGTSVAGAGDVNGDGFYDVIVGLPGFSNGESHEGVARVYYGSQSGLVTGFVFSLLEANQAGASFGAAVGGGMDVNGDGYDDVVVGAPDFDGQAANGGGVWVFHGSKTVVQNTAGFSASGVQAESHMGTSVSGGGDLNGDGYGDIIVGMPFFDQGGINNGGVTYAYFGNNGLAGKNRRNNIRLYNTGFQSVMTFTQNGQNAAGVGLFGASFLGRNNGRLAWETVTPGKSFSKVGSNPITNSTAYTSQQQSFYSLNPNGVDLKELISKQGAPVTRTRVRLKHELSTALTGQVYGPWRTIPEYLLLITAPAAPELPSESAENELFHIQPEFSEEITIYPNPVSDKIFIKSANVDQMKSVRLISVNGQTSYQSAKPQTELDVRHLAAGTYVLQISHKDGTQTSHRVVIKK